MDLVIRHLIAWKLVLSNKQVIGATEREYEQDRCHGLYNLISEATSHHFTIFCSLEVIKSGPYLKEEITQG